MDIEEINLGSSEPVSEDIGLFRMNYSGTRCHAQNSWVECWLIIVYMSVEGSEARENKEKYKLLGMLAEKYSNERVLIMGDFNGHTGVLGERVNKNGEMLMNFAEGAHMEVLNHTIAVGKITWQNRLFESAIDYFLVNT